MLAPAVQLFTSLDDNRQRRHVEKVWTYSKFILEAHPELAHEEFYKKVQADFDTMTEILVKHNSRKVKQYLKTK